MSAITLWERTRNTALGKLASLPAVEGDVQCSLRAAGFRAEPLLGEDGERANAVPMHQRDPTDRMVIATSLRTGHAVITSDAFFARYWVRVVW